MVTRNTAAAEAGMEYDKYRMQQLGSRHLHHHQQQHPNFNPNPSPYQSTPNPKSKRRGVLMPMPMPMPTDTNQSSTRSTTTRSLQLQVEARGKENNRGPKAPVIVIQQGSTEEFYTQDHDKLLGSCHLPWTGDQCNKHAAPIHDQVAGKTCHQCRQKTTGYRTSCCKCRLVQGQFCGQCLYTRYGENVLEAINNSDWICPVCRGICNCSLCRKKKGWNPTGPIYKKVANLGYKSVAHYLIQTRRKPGDTVQAPSSETKAALSDSTEAALSDSNEDALSNSTEAAMSDSAESAKENEPNPEVNILENTDDINGSSDEETMEKRRRIWFKRKKKRERRADSISPNPIAARLRWRHYGY